jgi:polyhydroxyalkanoate synthesis regulator phasin
MTLSPAQWDTADEAARLRDLRRWADTLNAEQRRRVEWLTDEHLAAVERGLSAAEHDAETMSEEANVLGARVDELEEQIGALRAAAKVAK